MADIDPKIDRIQSRPGYDDDFAAWIYHQAYALKARRFDELDLEELADEVESLAKRDFRKVRSALRVIILHMLKWDYQLERRDISWRRSINEHRERVWGELASSPSFRPRIDGAIEQIYLSARAKAWEETGVYFLEREPKTCPYTWDEIMTRPHELPADHVPENENDPFQGDWSQEDD